MPTAAVSLSPCVDGRFVGKAENIRPSPRACCATFPLDTQRRPEGPHVYIRTGTYICTSTGMYSTSTSIHRFGPTISGYPQDAPLLTFRVGYRYIYPTTDGNSSRSSGKPVGSLLYRGSCLPSEDLPASPFDRLPSASKTSCDQIPRYRRRGSSSS